jgi:carbonic anhydrase/acetyltransferase-like protein (isoleucine patch superfamily)
MASRTIVDSVALSSPPPNLAELEAELSALKTRFPGVIFQRYQDRIPLIEKEVFIAPGAALIGRVVLGEEASIWYGCVLRGDINEIVIGTRSNIQDGTVIHLGDSDPTIVGKDVVVGHRAVLHGCTIGDRCLIGIQATVLDGAQVGEGSIIGAGAVVPAGMVVPPCSLVLGMPGKVVKSLDAAAGEFHSKLARKYARLQVNYRRG